MLRQFLVGAAASGRNGGFLEASLTHGTENGLARFADEIEPLERLGAENFAGLRADLDRHGVACDWEDVGTLAVALEPHELHWLEEGAELLRRFGRFAHLVNSLSFALAQVLIAGVNLFALATVINLLLGWPTWVAIIVAAAVVLALGLGFFLVAIAYAHACERL